MKLKLLVLLLIAIGATAAFGQKPGVPLRNVPFKTTDEISDTDWAKLALALDREDWKQASTLAVGFLQTLTTENDKKQLARLRYYRLFALAGQVLKAIELGDTAGAERIWTEIDLAVEPLINKEFLMPARPFMADCNKKLNVICPVKEQANAMRVTATNQEGNAILSFDYVTFDIKPDILAFAGKNVFLGGRLRKVDYNEDKTKPWALRLIFDKGEMRFVIK